MKVGYSLFRALQKSPIEPKEPILFHFHEGDNSEISHKIAPALNIKSLFIRLNAQKRESIKHKASSKIK